MSHLAIILRPVSILFNCTINGHINWIHSLFPPLNYLLEQPLLGKEAETERGRENDSLGRIPGPDGTRPPSTAPAPGRRVGRTRNSFSDGHASLLAELSSPRRPRLPAARTGPHTREPAGLAAPAGTGILGDDPLCRGRSCRQRDSRAAPLPGPCAVRPSPHPSARGPAGPLGVGF